MQYLDRPMLPCPSSWIKSAVREQRWTSLTALMALSECTAVGTLRTSVLTALDARRVRPTCTIVTYTSSLTLMVKHNVSVIFCFVICHVLLSTVGAPCSSPGNIRLVGGVDQFQGRVEVCTNASVYSTVCSEGWDNLDAQVVCSQLGFNGIPNFNLSQVVEV